MQLSGNKFITSEPRARIHSTGVTVLMAKLEDFEESIREKIEKEHWTHAQLSSFLIAEHPGERGFSVRSIERFCSDKGIHKTTKLCDVEVDELITGAVAKVLRIIITVKWVTLTLRGSFGLPLKNSRVKLNLQQRVKCSALMVWPKNGIYLCQRPQAIYLLFHSLLQVYVKVQ